MGRDNLRRMGRTGLYRLFGADGTLLYIGIGETPSDRLRCHTAMKDWWSDVVRAEVIWLPTRAEAEAAELRAIADEKPLYNVMGTTKHFKQPDQIVPLPDRPSVTTKEIAATLNLKPAYVSQSITTRTGFPAQSGRDKLHRIYPTDLVREWIAKHRPHCLPADQANAS